MVLNGRVVPIIILYIDSDVTAFLSPLSVADPGFDLRGGVDFVNGGWGVANH